MHVDRTQVDKQDPSPDGGAIRKTRRQRRRRRIGLWSLLSVAAMAGAAVLLVLSYLGTPITMPDWARARIAARISAAADGIQVDLGEMIVTVEQGWKPRLALRDVALRTPEGAPLVTLSELGGTLAMRSLLEGQVQPGTIRASGVQLHLKRAAGGRINVALGRPDKAAGREARDIAAVVAQIDGALQRPVLAGLRQVEIDNISLLYEDARAGRAWTVDGGRIELRRSGDDLAVRGDFALLGGRAYPTTLELSYSSQIGQPNAALGLNFADMPADDIAGQSPALAWLGALKAPISGALRASVGVDGRLGLLSATLQIGPGVLQPTEATKAIAFSAARTYLTYDPATQTMRFDELSLVSKWVTAQAEGTAFLVDLKDGWPTELQAQMRVSNIEANPDNLYPEPVRIQGATMDFRLRLDPFRLSVGEMNFSDQGQRMVLRGDLSAEPEGWDLSVDGRMDGLRLDRLKELWPAPVSPNTREWVAENLRKAQFSNIQVAVRSHAQSRPEVFLGFDFAGLETRFVKKLPLVTDASGHAALLDDRFALHVESGRVTPPLGGAIDVTGTSFVVADTKPKQPDAHVALKLRSTITAALSLLDEEPLKFLSKAGQPVTLADGRADLRGTLDFTLKKKVQHDDVRFAISGDLSDVASSVLVPGRVLSADRLQVTADNDAIAVGGDGRIGAVPVSGQWRSALGPQAEGQSHLNGQVELSQRFADEFGVGLPPGSLSGAAKGEITIDLQRGGGGDFVLTSDLGGLGMRLHQLDWSKADAARGALEVRGRLGTPPGIDRLTIEAPGLDATGSVALRADGQLDRAIFSRVRVGGWLDAPVELMGRGAGVTPRVNVTGGSVDLRQTTLTSARDASQKQGGPISLRLDRLQISDGIALTGFSAELDTSRGADGTFSGKVNGGASVTGRVVPQQGRSAFRIQSANAGGVLGSARLLKQARGGTMDLILTPGDGAGIYEGQLDAKNVWLTDAPALAALLNTLSVVGLLEQLTGNGILFGQIDARFRLAPDRVTVFSSSAVGSSLGITMDGYYFTEKGVMDMQGVVSPLYLVNSIGGVLTRQGEGLVGFNYKLRGTAADPKVRILPLTLFTPGMFRDIFRRAPPGVPSRRQQDTDANKDAGGTRQQQRNLDQRR